MLLTSSKVFKLCSLKDFIKINPGGTVCTPCMGCLSGFLALVPLSASCQCIPWGTGMINSWLPADHLENLDCILGPQFLLYPVLTIAGSWVVKQQMKSFPRSSHYSLLVSSHLIKNKIKPKALNYRLEENIWPFHFYKDLYYDMQKKLTFNY